MLLAPVPGISSLEKLLHAHATPFSKTLLGRPIGPAKRKEVPKDLRGNLSLLEGSSVAIGTVKDYRRRCILLVRWILDHRDLPKGFLQIQECLLAYLDHMYLLGHPADLGQKTIAAVMFFNPLLGNKGPFRMFRVVRALKGWGRLAPNGTREPLPWLGLMALIGALLSRKKLTQAFALLLGFALYLRPGELLALTACSLTPPLLSAGRPHYYERSGRLQQELMILPNATRYYGKAS